MQRVLSVHNAFVQADVLIKLLRHSKQTKLSSSIGKGTDCADIFSRGKPFLQVLNVMDSLCWAH